MTIKLFFTSVSCSLETKKNQEKIQSILDGKKIPYEVVDIAQNTDDLNLMRSLAGNPSALPPQICNGDIYCGDFTAFANAIEMEELALFLNLK